MKKKADWMTKAKKRKVKKRDRGIVDVMMLMQHYFKELSLWFNEMTDPRHPSYTTYTQADLGGCKIFCVYGNETFQIRIRYVVVFVGFCSRIFCRIYLSGYSISCPLSFIHAF